MIRSTCRRWSTPCCLLDRPEFADVPGSAAVRLLYAPPLVDQGAARHVHLALGAAGSPSLHLGPLDIDWRDGLDEPLVGRAVRDRGPDVVQSLVAGAGLKYRRLYLEMDAVLDRDLHRRPHDDSQGAP